LRHNTPWVKQLPSLYLREHIRFTLQPTDAPPDPTQLRQILEQMESDELLMFATDYPHWQYDTPEEALPAVFDGALRDKVLSKNAQSWYQFA